MGLKFINLEIQKDFDSIDPIRKALLKDRMITKFKNNMEFKTLYKKTSTGANQQWRISVNGCEITTEYGKVGGKLVTSHETIKEGKNFGKSNGTLPEEQAILEAKATYQGKLKKGYVESLDGAIAGEVDKVIGGGMFPMLAHKFSDQGHKIIYPALAQPKLDGHCCIAIKENGIWTLWSRTRKPILSCPHIIEALSKTNIDYILHGELYNHDYKNKFEELTHFIRQDKYIPGSEVVQYHIYDVADPRLHQSKRIDLLASFNLSNPLVCVNTLEVEDENNLMDTFDIFIRYGYEGAMVRNRLGMYINNRSYDLLKVKEFEDSEFKVVGVEEGKGIMAGKAIFILETEKGSEFKAKMIGSLSNLEKYITNPELAIGKMATIKYQGVTTKSGVPRFPVCIKLNTSL